MEGERRARIKQFEAKRKVERENFEYIQQIRLTAIRKVASTLSSPSTASGLAHVSFATISYGRLSACDLRHVSMAETHSPNKQIRCKWSLPCHAYAAVCTYHCNFAHLAVHADLVSTFTIVVLIDMSHSDNAFGNTDVVRLNVFAVPPSLSLSSLLYGAPCG